MRRRAAEKRLHELLLALQHNRSLLSDAERVGDAAVQEGALIAIRTQYALIRSHCAEHGLERPHDVPATGGESEPEASA